MRRPNMKRYWPILRDYLLLTIGALLAAVAVDVFLVPNNVVVGGLPGAAMLLHASVGTPVGLVTLLANIPLFIIGFRSLGGDAFCLCTLFPPALDAVPLDLPAPCLGS